MRRISSIGELDEIIKLSGFNKQNEPVYKAPSEDDNDYIDKNADQELKQRVKQQRERVFSELEERLNKQTRKDREHDKLMEAIMLAEVIGTPRCKRGRNSRRNFIKR